MVRHWTFGVQHARSEGHGVLVDLDLTESENQSDGDKSQDGEGLEYVGECQEVGLLLKQFVNRC